MCKALPYRGQDRAARCTPPDAIEALWKLRRLPLRRQSGRSDPQEKTRALVRPVARTTESPALTIVSPSWGSVIPTVHSMDERSERHRRFRHLENRREEIVGLHHVAASRVRARG